MFWIVIASCKFGLEVTSDQAGGPGYVTLAVLSAIASVTDDGTEVK